MGKRVLSLLLALVMVVGMIPATAFGVFATETETAKPNLLAASAAVSVDGSLAEVAWLTYGKMTSEDGATTRNFGVLWDRTTLYLGFRGTEDVTVTVNGEAVAAAANVAGSADREMAVSLEAAGVLYSEKFDITVADANTSWSGTVTLDAADRLYKPTKWDYASSSGTGGTRTVNTSVADRIIMGNTHAEGATTTNKDARNYVIRTTTDPLFDVNATSVVEFDFTATDMPAYSDDPRIIDDDVDTSTQLCNGFVFALGQGKSVEAAVNGFAAGTLFGYTVGIANTLTKGLMFCTRTASGEKMVEMGKQEGDTFHVRFEYTPKGDMKVFIDDTLLATYADPMVHRNWSKTHNGMLSFNLFDHSGSQENMSFTISEIRVSTKDPREPLWHSVKANVTEADVVLDGNADEAVWSHPHAIVGSDVKGSVSAAWGKGKLYLAARYVGATELNVNLADKSWKIDLTKTDVATEDGAVTGKVADGVAELAIDLVKAGISVAAYNQAVAFQATLSDGTNTAVLSSDYKPELVFSSEEPVQITTSSLQGGFKLTDGKFTISGVSGRGYSYWNNALVDHSCDTYLEQTLTIRDLPGDGAFVNGSLANAKGYSFWIGDQVAGEYSDLSIGVLYAVEGQLKLKVCTKNNYANGYAEVDLGKALNTEGATTLKLGYLWRTDDTAEIYVDGMFVGAVKNALIQHTNGFGKDTVCINTYGLVDLDVENIYYTKLYSKEAPAVTLDQLLNGVDTSAVTENLPNVYEASPFVYTIDWNSSNTDAITDDGVVTRSEQSVDVELTPVVGGQKLEKVTVTVHGTGVAPVIPEVEVEAFVAPGTAVLDGVLDDVLWAFPNGLNSVTGTGVSGVSYMAWGKGTLHVAVAHSGASELEVQLKDKTWKIDLTKADIATEDGLVTGKNANGVAELKINMLKAGVEVLAFGQTENFQLKLTGETGTAALAQKATLKFIDKETARFTVPDYNKNSNTGTKIDGRTEEFKGNTRQYMTLGTSQIVHSKDIFLEQTLTIKELTDADGAVNNAYDADGLAIGIFETKTTGTVAVVYAQGQDLYLRVAQPNKAYENLALGKQVGDTFHLGYLWTTDDRAVIYVDGVKIGEVSNVTYAHNWGAGTFAYNVAASLTYDIQIQDVAFSLLKGMSVPASTTAGVLTGINTDAVTNDLPTTYINGHFAYNVTWVSDNEAVIAADGKVTRPEGQDAQVKVAAVVGGKTLEEVTVTVPSLRPSDEALFDGQLAAYFVSAMPAADAAAWNSVTWEYFEGTSAHVAALVYNQKVYLAVRNAGTGTVSATLGEENETAELVGGAALLCFDETKITAYNQEFSLQVTVGETNAWAEGGKVTVEAKVLNAPKNVPIGDALIPGRWVSRTDKSITFKVTSDQPAFDSSNCAYYIQNKSLAAMYDGTKDMLLEQVLNITAMPHSSKSGSFDGIPNTAHGYTIMYEVPSAVTSGKFDFYSCVVYAADSEGNLALNPITASGTVGEAVDLGVKVGTPFKLGLNYAADGSMQVYVDDELVADLDNIRYTRSNIYSCALMLKYLDEATKTEGNDAEMTISDLTLTIMGNTTDLGPVEEEITKEAIFGDLKLDKVTENLPLVTTFQSAFLGEQTLRWESSNEAAVKADGTVTPSETKKQTATLSVFLGDSETALWSVEVVIPASMPSINALLSEEAIVVDGKLTESAWLNWYRFKNPNGNIAAAWTKGYVFFAVHSKDADTLNLTLGGKVITVDLVAGTVTGAANALIAKNAVTGVIEIGIPLSDIEFNLTNYNQVVSCSVALAKGEASAALDVKVLKFSGDIAAVQSLSGYTKSSGPWTLLPDSIVYNGSEAGGTHYVYKNGNPIDHSEVVVFSNDFLIEALPKSDGGIISSAQADGFYFYFNDADNDSTTNGTMVFTAIFTEDGENLKIRISDNVKGGGTVYDIAKKLGEKFRLTYFWNPDNTLEIYVDGVLLAIHANAGYYATAIGTDVVSFRYWCEAASSEKVKFTVSGQTLIQQKYEAVVDELTLNAVFGRIDLDHVQKDLPMVTSFASANFAALNLKWTTSDASVVTADGKITRHATEAKSALITVYFIDDEGNEIKLWDVTVTVDPMSVTKQAAPSIIHTAFAAPGSIKIDGVVETEETWLLNGWVVNDAGQAVGYFGTQWDQENLYVLLDTEAENVVLNLGGQEIPVTKTGKITELQIPVSQLLKTAKLEQTGITMEITVTMGEDSYTGKLQLSNVDWWATDNVYAGLPMLANNVKSVKMGTADQPDGNQGAKQLENGYHLYDLYDAEGSNPAGIRTYVLFMKMPVYENFADRTEATQIEFDFYAQALPEWEWDEGIKNEMGRAFANYGVTFSLSDKADSAKNSNVAVFGIVNTAEGLVLVVNRGTNDYEKFNLNKQVGEEFRIGLTWLTNANLVLTIDGEEITTIQNMSKFVNSVGDTSFVVNMIRNKVKPTSAADDMDVYLTNIAFGRAHATENIIRNLTFADICGKNEAEGEITTDLVLPTYMTNGQLDHQYPITWTSSDASVIDPATGKVTRPASGVKVVVLTATLEYPDGTTETKEFNLIVHGLSISNGNVLVAGNDVAPFTTGAAAYNGLLYNLDETNNSVVYAFPEGEVEKINLITLTDLDAVSRLNRESLRLFVSDDNKTYTEIKDYKLHHDGYNWYLYDFEAEARYIKVHYTHREYGAADFTNTPGEMIHVSWNESLVIPEDAAEIDVPATTLRDQAVVITLPEGIEAEGLRVALNGEILFHFVDKDGNVYVRIADPTEGKLLLWNAEDIELADKENVYEVTYGTRETLPSSGRWVLGLKKGQIFPTGESLAADTLYHMSGSKVYASTDGGYDWKHIGSISFSTGLSSGGWGIDSVTGRIFHEFYGPAAFNGSDITKSECITYVFYSDDGGKTWTKAEGLGKIEGDVYSNYVLSYTDITELKTTYENGRIVRGNDGTGPNVDFVFPMGAQFNNNGAFCGRVAYTRDGGETWHYSESLITYGNETAFEGGVSEATILEREDGTLVYYARCQSSGVDNFTISYSLDHGVTWLTPGGTSSIYTTNTQALMMTYDFGGFDGNRVTGTPIFMWGGNNVLGGSSYMRMPLNFAVSTNGMDTWRNIQNIFSETFMDTFTTYADHYITNPSIQQINGDDMYVSFSRLNQKDSIYMVVNDFTDWFIRTKGAYDSFEHGNAQYEGWVIQKGAIEATKAQASVGNYSMLVKENTQVTRTVPYLQNGKLSIDLYVDANSNFLFELQPAYSNVEMKCAVISAKVNGTTMTLHDGTVLTLKSGWNTVTFDLELTEYKASVSINGGEKQAVAVNEQFNGPNKHELGNYITYATILASSDIYVDELFIESYLDAVVEATEADETAANAVIEQIKALEANENRTNADIAEVKAAYNALTQVQKDLVKRNVRISAEDTTITSGVVTDYMVNYYDVLMSLKNSTYVGSASLTLNGNIGVNFYTKVSDLVAKIGATMIITLPNGEEVEIALSDDLKTDYYGEDGWYKFSCEIPAKEMADNIHVKLVDAEGNVLDEFDYKAMDYVEAVLNSDLADSYKQAAVALANYGAYAQKFFGHNTGVLANEGVTGTWKDAYEAAFNAVDASDLESFAASAVDNTKPVTLYSVSLLLKSETTMRLFFKVADGVDGNSVTFNGKAADGMRNNLYYVDIANISAKDLGQTVTVTVNDGTDSYEVSYNPLAYCYSVLGGNDAALKDVAKAMYLYYLSASEALN